MASALEITNTLKGTWYQSYGTAACPVCQPERRVDQNALSISEDARGHLLAHCHKSGCAFRDILMAAGGEACLPAQTSPETIARRRAEYDSQAACKAHRAKACWQQAQPISGTLAETYIRNVRGISSTLPDTLRFHPDCYHGPSGRCYPALLALVQGSRSFAVHRTFLAPDGSGKAPVKPPKMMLGRCGGGAVRLAKPAGSLMVGEGIETCLAAMQLFGKPAWAALSAGNLTKIHLPAHVKRVTVLADGEDAGRTAAQASAERLKAQGREAQVLYAPLRMDFNDVLLEDIAVAREGIL